MGYEKSMLCNIKVYFLHFYSIKKKKTALDSKRFFHMLANLRYFLYQLARTVTDDYIVNFWTSSEFFFESFFGSGDECFV